MCDIEKILKNFEEKLNSKSPEEKVSYLKSFGFQVCEKEDSKASVAKKQRQNKAAVMKA